jgi:hypothetical protein
MAEPFYRMCHRLSYRYNNTKCLDRLTYRRPCQLASAGRRLSTRALSRSGSPEFVASMIEIDTDAVRRSPVTRTRLPEKQGRLDTSVIVGAAIP